MDISQGRGDAERRVSEVHRRELLNGPRQTGLHGVRMITSDD